MPYAQNTAVPVDRSRNEIERNLIRFGASGFGYGWEGSREVVSFIFAGKQVRMVLTMPPRSTFRSEEAMQKERRRRWRSLAAVIKATLIAVDDGILSFEDAFLSYFVLPSGLTLGEQLIPRLEAAAERGELPRLMLPEPSRGRDL